MKRPIAAMLLAVLLSAAAPAHARYDDDEGSSSSFYMGGSLNFQAISSSDILRLYNGTPGEASPWWDWGFYGDMRAGWLSPLGLGLEAGYQNHNRLTEIANKRSTSSGSYTDLGGFSANTKTWFVEPLFRRGVSRRLAFIGGVKLGVTETYFNASQNGRSTFNAMGQGTLVAPEARIQFLFGGRFGLELGLEWRLPSAGPFTDGNGKRVQVLVNGQLEDWRLEGSGPAFRLGLTYYFSRLANPVLPD